MQYRFINNYFALANHDTFLTALLCHDNWLLLPLSCRIMITLHHSIQYTYLITWQRKLYTTRPLVMCKITFNTMVKITILSNGLISTMISHKYNSSCTWPYVNWNDYDWNSDVKNRKVASIQLVDIDDANQFTFSCTTLTTIGKATKHNLDLHLVTQKVIFGQFKWPYISYRTSLLTSYTPTTIIHKRQLFNHSSL